MQLGIDRHAHLCHTVNMMKQRKHSCSIKSLIARCIGHMAAQPHLADGRANQTASNDETGVNAVLFDKTASQPDIETTKA